MHIVCPRQIKANRGDLLSRYGILAALVQGGLTDMIVFCNKPDQICDLPLRTVPYGRLHDLLPDPEGWRALKHGKVVLWTAGLDLQDDSSLSKILFILLLFTIYRLLGLRIYVLMQGAGPLTTSWGRIVARGILNRVETFYARDPGSYELLEGLGSRARVKLGHDGIFLGEVDLVGLHERERATIDQLTNRGGGQPLIGLNIRQWFHFSSSILPYKLAKNSYRHRSEAEMSRFMEAMAGLMKRLREEMHARILLISSYEPHVEPWEDDLPWLLQLKAYFANDDQVLAVEHPLSLGGYCRLLSAFDLMIGTRLHSTLAALRFGVPAINMSYTLKGRAIFNYLGLNDWVVDLEEAIATPDKVYALAGEILKDADAARRRVTDCVRRSVQENQKLIDDLLRELEQLPGYSHA